MVVSCQPSPHFTRFHEESDHSNGSFRFGGWIVTFEIHDDVSGLVMLVGMEEGFL